MSMTGEALVTALSQFLGDEFESVTTSSGSVTQIVDVQLKQFGDRANEEAWVRILTDSVVPGNLYDQQRITQFVTDTLTVAPGFPQTVQSAVTYQIHRFKPSQKFAAIDRAVYLAYPQVAKILVDEVLVSDGWNTELPVPDAIRKGPAQVWVETPLPVNVRWNVVPTALATNVSPDGWTQTSVTATTYTRSTNDTIVPRLETACIRITGGSGATDALSLPVSALNITAAGAAGKRMTLGIMVYSRTAGPTVFVTDDSGTYESTAHDGLGWRMLKVTRNIVGSNATTLTIGVRPHTNDAIYMEHTYFGVTDNVQIDFSTPMMRYGVYRTDERAVVRLKQAAPQGFMYRLEGRAPCSTLGTDPVTQTTNTIEVSPEDQDLLVATAARILLTWTGMQAAQMEEMYPGLAVAEARFKEMETDWRRRYPRASFIDSSWISG